LPWVLLDKNAALSFLDWKQIRLDLSCEDREYAGFITTVLYLNFDSMSADAS